MTDRNGRSKYEVGTIVGGYKLLERAHTVDGNQYWSVECLKCKTVYKRRPAGIKRSNTKECEGCTTPKSKTHGLNGTYTWVSWCRMLQRVRGTGGNNRYVERGITVCDEWLQYENFLRDMGERPKGLTLDRIDNDGPYTKENCRWADYKTQRANQSGRRREPMKQP